MSNHTGILLFIGFQSVSYPNVCEKNRANADRKFSPQQKRAKLNHEENQDLPAYSQKRCR